MIDNATTPIHTITPSQVDDQPIQLESRDRYQHASPEVDKDANPVFVRLVSPFDIGIAVDTAGRVEEEMGHHDRAGAEIGTDIVHAEIDLGGFDI